MQHFACLSRYNTARLSGEPLETIVEPTSGWGLTDVLPVLGASTASGATAGTQEGGAGEAGGEPGSDALVVVGGEGAVDSGGGYGEGWEGGGQGSVDADGNYYYPPDAYAMVPAEGGEQGAYEGWGGADGDAWAGYGQELVPATSEQAPEYVQLYDEASGTDPNPPPLPPPSSLLHPLFLCSGTCACRRIEAAGPEILSFHAWRPSLLPLPLPGYMYYMHTATGQTFWELPADASAGAGGGEALALEDGAVAAGDAGTASGGGAGGAAPAADAPAHPAAGAVVGDPAVATGFPGVELCVMCEERVAVKHCLECDDKLCDRCFTWSHSKGSLREHRYIAM